MRTSTRARRHHPWVRHRRAGWAWSCQCGAFEQSGRSAHSWHNAYVAALRHAEHALR